MSERRDGVRGTFLHDELDASVSAAFLADNLAWDRGFGAFRTGLGDVGTPPTAVPGADRRAAVA